MVRLTQQQRRAVTALDAIVLDSKFMFAQEAIVARELEDYMPLLHREPGKQLLGDRYFLVTAYARLGLETQRKHLIAFLLLLWLNGRYLEITNGKRGLDTIYGIRMDTYMKIAAMQLIICSVNQLMKSVDNRLPQYHELAAENLQRIAEVPRLLKECL